MGLADYLAKEDEEAVELEKQAAEEDAAGRITARGFMDELNKLATAKPGVRANKESSRSNEEGARSPSSSTDKPEGSQEEATPSGDAWSEAQS